MPKITIPRENYPEIERQIADGWTAAEIAAPFGCEPETVRKFARRRGLKIQRQDMTMEQHPSWKGGTTLDRQGYELQRVDAAGELGYLIRALRPGDHRGYAPTHRIVMHQKLGRRLRADEVVHHIDGDIRNNHPDNLDVFRDNAKHLAVTLKGKRPNWTPEGRARMTGRPPRKSRAVTSLPAPKSAPSRSDGPS